MNHTKRVILMGGLGNQLFQYSFALSLVQEFDCKVILDPNFDSEKNLDKYNDNN
jgi:hypothetical protein